MGEQRDLREIKELIDRAEALTDQLVRLVPKGKPSDWVRWRGEGLQRRLCAARCELKKTIEAFQIFILEKAAAERQYLFFTVSKDFPHKILSCDSPGEDLPLQGKLIRQIFDPVVTFRYEQAMRSLQPRQTDVLSHNFTCGTIKMRWQVKIENRGTEAWFHVSVQYSKSEPKTAGLGL